MLIFTSFIRINILKRFKSLIINFLLFIKFIIVNLSLLFKLVYLLNLLLIRMFGDAKIVLNTIINEFARLIFITARTTILRFSLNLFSKELNKVLGFLLISKSVQVENQFVLRCRMKTIIIVSFIVLTFQGSDTLQNNGFIVRNLP